MKGADALKKDVIKVSVDKDVIQNSHKTISDTIPVDIEK